METYDLIAERFGFELPQKYCAVRAAGLFDGLGSHELVLTDLYWLTLPEIANSQPPAGLVPFARTGRRELFCWYTLPGTDGGTPVAFFPRGESPILYAGDFDAFLYRALLEEFSMSWLVNGFGLTNSAARLRRYAEDVSSFLPHEWATTLHELSRRPLVQWETGVYGVLSREECDKTIRQALSSPELNKPVDFVSSPSQDRRVHFAC
jgi:hypothetical protein